MRYYDIRLRFGMVGSVWFRLVFVNAWLYEGPCYVHEGHANTHGGYVRMSL
jgi:hypothetical protein